MSQNIKQTLYSELKQNQITEETCNKIINKSSSIDGFYNTFSDIITFCSSIIPLYFFKSDDKDNIINDLLIPNHHSSCSFTEKESGSSISNMRSEYERNEDNTFNVNGEKFFISNFSRSKYSVIYARSKHTQSPLSMSVFITNTARESQSIDQKEIAKTCLVGLPASHIKFINTKVNLIGQEDEGYSIFSYFISWEKVLLSFANIGLLELLIRRSKLKIKQLQAEGIKKQSLKELENYIIDFIVVKHTSLSFALKCKNDLFLDQRTESSTTLKLFMSNQLINLIPQIHSLFGKESFYDKEISQIVQNFEATSTYSGSKFSQQEILKSRYL